MAFLVSWFSQFRSGIQRQKDEGETPVWLCRIPMRDLQDASPNIRCERCTIFPTRRGMPEIPISLRISLRKTRFLKPLISVEVWVITRSKNLLPDALHASMRCWASSSVPRGGTDVFIIRDVIANVDLRRSVVWREPDIVNIKVCEIWQLSIIPGMSPMPSSFGVVEGWRVYLVDAGFLPSFPVMAESRGRRHHGY